MPNAWLKMGWSRALARLRANLHRLTFPCRGRLKLPFRMFGNASRSEGARIQNDKRIRDQLPGSIHMNDIKHGPTWEPTADGIFGSATSVAHDLLRHVLSIIESEKIKERCKGVSVTFRFASNNALNAAVAKPSRGENSYEIVVYTGVISATKEVFSHRDYISLVKRESNVLARLSDAEIVLFSQYIAILALVHHEMAHIFRGHLDLIEAMKKSAHLWFECASDSPDAKEARARFLSECHADTISGFMLGIDLQAKTSSLTARLGSGNADAAIAAMLLLSVSAFVLFACLEDRQGVEKGLYPPAEFRAFMVCAQAVQSYAPDIQEQVAAKVLSFGLMAPQKLSKLFSVSRVTLTRAKLDELLAQLPEIDRFGSEVIIHSPCRSSR